MTMKPQALPALVLALLFAFVMAGAAHAQTAAPATPAAPAAGAAPGTPSAPPNPAFDPALAQRLGADRLGMRHYVMVILKTGPKPVPAGKERDAMFAGHFANIKRMAAQGLLKLAGPADGVEGWRGIYIFAVPDVAQAQQLTQTDPVIAQGEMVAEYHRVYLSAALMELPAMHDKVAATTF